MRPENYAAKKKATAYSAHAQKKKPGPAGGGSRPAEAPRDDRADEKDSAQAKKTKKTTKRPQKDAAAAPAGAREDSSAMGGAMSGADSLHFSMASWSASSQSSIAGVEPFRSSRSRCRRVEST